jgi:cytochrome c-type protein NapB
MNGDVSPTIRRMRSRRAWHVIGLLAIGAAGGGFCTGLAQQRELVRHRVAPETVATTLAPGYAQLRDERIGPNANLYPGALARLSDPLPPLLPEGPIMSEQQRAAVLATRSLRRAYDGAPPTIPHGIDAKGTVECFACHEKGAVIAGKRAPATSHARHDNCTQCHVAASGPPSPPPPPLASNSFVGLSASRRGERAWPGSPPKIPHSTLMRTECVSCHGVRGELGTRTHHPMQANVSAREWGESCTHCHLPSAALDQTGAQTMSDPHE